MFGDFDISYDATTPLLYDKIEIIVLYSVSLSLGNHYSTLCALRTKHKLDTSIGNSMLQILFQVEFERGRRGVWGVVKVYQNPYTIGPMRFSIYIAISSKGVSLSFF